MITKTEEDLIVGKRYWLGKRKDCSGVFHIKDDKGFYFNDIEGDNPYIESAVHKGCVGFATTKDFISVEE